MNYPLRIVSIIIVLVPRKLLNNIVIPPEFNNMENYFDKLPLQKNTLSFDEINEIAILDIIDKLKNRNSSGIDNISNKAIKVVNILLQHHLD